VALCVEECSAMLHAQSRMMTTIADITRQLEQKRAMDTERMPKYNQDEHWKDVTQFETDLSTLRAQLEELEKTYVARRDHAIAQYLPLLNQSVFRFAAAYATLRKKERQRLEGLEGSSSGGDALEAVAARCREVKKHEGPMMQPWPYSGRREVTEEDSHIRMLLTLLHRATVAHSVLEKTMHAVKSHVQDQCQGTEVEIKGPSVKGVERACAKTKEDYGGNYRMLCDLLRGTLVFPSLHAISVAMSFSQTTTTANCRSRSTRAIVA